MPFFILLALLAGCSSSPAPRGAASAPAPAATAVVPSPSPTTAAPGTVEAPTVTPETDLKAQTFLDQGYAYYVRGDYSRAIQTIETVFLFDAQFPENWARYILYYCYLATGDYPSALRVAEELLRAAPAEPLAYQQVGMAHLWLGNAALALQAFQRASDFESHSPRLRFYEGLALDQASGAAARDRAFQKAEAEYDEILRRNPKDFVANYELAALYLFWNRNLNRASRLVGLVKESAGLVADDDVPADRKLMGSFFVPLLEGILLHRRGEFRGSIKLLSETLPLAPAGSKADLAEIYHYVGRNYLALGEEPSARTFLERAVTLDPKGPYAGEDRVLVAKRAKER